MHKQPSGTAAILKSVDKLKTQKTDILVTIYTDSQTTLDSLKNNNIQTNFLEKRRKRIEEDQTEWKIQFRWAKVHVGILGNNLPTP